MKSPQEISDYRNSWRKNGYSVDVSSGREKGCIDWCSQRMNTWEYALSRYTDVYTHTFFFEDESMANAFAEVFSNAKK